MITTSIKAKKHGVKKMNEKKEDVAAKALSELAAQPTWRMKRLRKVITKPPPVSSFEAMANASQRYYEAKEKEYAKAAVEERLTVEQWMDKIDKQKKKEVKEWNGKDIILKGIKKSKDRKKKLILVEEAEPIAELVPHFSIVEPNNEMVGTATVLEPTID